MKKILALFILLITLSADMEAQKAGILKIDNYGAFTGDDYQEFLFGHRAPDFEKKATITLVQYIGLVDSTVKAALKEPSIASAFNNSTVKPFPAGAKVYTCNNKGEWKFREAYAGESGLYHEPTGTYWLSFMCGNPTAFKGPAPTIPNPSASSVLTANTVQPGNVNTLLVTTGGGGNQLDGTSFDKGVSVERNALYDAMTVQTIATQNVIAAQNAMRYYNQQPQQVVPMTTTGFGQSMPGITYPQTPSLQTVPPQQVIFEQQKPPFGQTLAGQIIAHTVGAVVETAGDAIIANNYPMRSTTYVVNNGNTIPVGGPVNVGTTGNNIVHNR